jgi:hypothetical protein
VAAVYVTASRLALYLDEATRSHHDCCTFMADWLIKNGLPDPMGDRRGTYFNRREYQRLISGEGGVLASCDRRFAAIGLQETLAPKAGDVAIVRAPIASKCGFPIFGATGAICVSETMRAVVASDLALAIAGLEIIKAWTFHG